MRRSRSCHRTGTATRGGRAQSDGAPSPRMSFRDPGSRRSTANRVAALSLRCDQGPGLAAERTISAASRNLGCPRVIQSHCAAANLLWRGREKRIAAVQTIEGGKRQGRYCSLVGAPVRPASLPPPPPPPRLSRCPGTEKWCGNPLHLPQPGPM